MRRFRRAETLTHMDMSGAMPRSAWVEIRDADGELIVSIPAEVNGGSITADLPAFPAGTYGTIQLCEDYGDSIEREEPKLVELPTDPQMMLVQMG
jgi:hypothetical protein